jgi:hypothetical protein
VQRTVDSASQRMRDAQRSALLTVRHRECGMRSTVKYVPDLGM